jgi:hypothetical protein
MFAKLLIITALIVFVALIAMAVKILFTKSGKFEKSCGSVDPTTGKRMQCSCGSEKDQECHNDAEDINQ